MLGGGGTETQVLNLVRHDIPEKNNTASPSSRLEGTRAKREVRKVCSGQDDPENLEPELNKNFDNVCG